MSSHAIHPHAEFDHFPRLLEHFGGDIDTIIAAEWADFVWDSRFVERDLGAWDGFDDDEASGVIVRIIGYFRRRYLVATCVVDGERRVRALLTQRGFDCFEDAEQAFLDGGG
ncbi:hypothetical protein [Magnetospirillum sp. 15-1]|uniref:hypothetical protein n=1 Tax=Magnetospirillum sp. 15-1 TaxID=1979370 RepID=UPI000BBCEC02|nr:hypothetical protein [Magnetospirillum sp. 15-1]